MTVLKGGWGWRGVGSFSSSNVSLIHVPFEDHEVS